MIVFAAMVVAEINLIYAKRATGVREILFFLMQAVAWVLFQVKLISKAMEISEGKKISMAKMLLFDFDDFDEE